MASEVNHHVGYSRENKCWFVRFYPYQTEQQALDAIMAFTRSAPATDIEDLLKKAVAAFNALSPEQQAEMMEEQRQSWVRGNVGLSRDERGMTSPVMPRPAPAATDTGLVTVLPLEWRKYRNGDAEAVTPFGEIYTAYVNGYWRITRNGKAGKFIKATGGDDVEAAKSGAQADFDANVLSLVRSQAEELLAAERAEKEKLEAAWLEAEGIISDLKADNAAKDARIKELEGINANLMGDDEDKPRYTTKRLKHEIARATEALEAKLAAAEKALEPFADHAKERAVDAPEWRDTDTVQIVVTIGDLRAARAALGGKP